MAGFPLVLSFAKGRILFFLSETVIFEHEIIQNIKQNHQLDDFSLDYKKRINLLKKLKQNILENEQKIYDAFIIDLNKSNKETYLCEVSEVISEIDNFVRHLKKWMKTQKVKASYQVFGTISRIIKKPQGRVLIIIPFNYPFNLCFIPLVGSIGAGNKTLIKLSNQTPNVNNAIKAIIENTFDNSIVDVIEDNDLKDYNEIYDYEPNLVFFTGSTRTGKIVETECVKRNINYVTELGGQCPCIVESIKTDKVYDRLVWSKFLCAGQTCVGINYIIYNDKIVDFESKLIESIKKQYPNTIENKNIVKIISKKEFDRLVKIIEENKKDIIYGGQYDKTTLIIEPTVIKLKEEQLGKYGEVFGPILFICDSNKSIQELVKITKQNDPSPLSAYIYSNNKEVINYFLNNVNAGGYGVNDSVIHLTNPNLPFGGVYTSGTGVYHGKYSFDTFSFLKPVIFNNSSYNIPIKFINNKYDLKKTKSLIKIAKKLKP